MRGWLLSRLRINCPSYVEVFLLEDQEVLSTLQILTCLLSIEIWTEVRQRDRWPIDLWHLLVEQIDRCLLFSTLN